MDRWIIITMMHFYVHIIIISQNHYLSQAWK